MFYKFVVIDLTECVCVIALNECVTVRYHSIVVSVFVLVECMSVIVLFVSEVCFDRGSRIFLIVVMINW